MAYLDVVSTYIPEGTGPDGRPLHQSRQPTMSVHQMVEHAAQAINPEMLAAARDSNAATFHCGTLYQGEHFWPIQNSLQGSILQADSAGAATEIRQFCSGGLYGLMIADALLEAGWAGEYAVVTGGDSLFYFDRHEYAAHPATEGSLLGDSAFCAVLNRSGGFARILSASARSHNPSADMMRARPDRGMDDPTFPTLTDWIKRWQDYEQGGPRTLADNAMDSFRTAVSTVTDCYRRIGLEAEDINWFAPSYIEPSFVTETLAKQTRLRLVPGLRSFAAEFGHLTVSDFGLNLAYLMNNNIAKAGELVLLFAAGNFVNSAAVLLRIEKETTLPLHAPNLNVVASEGES